MCARLAAGGPDAGSLSRRPCRGGDGCRHARRRSERRRAERRADAPGYAGGPLLHGHGGAGVAGGAAGLHPRGARRPEDLSFLAGARRRRRRGRCSAPSRRTKGAHARRLLAAVYLITGERYCPAICYPPLRCDGYCAALREAVSRGGLRRLQLCRASQETLDPAYKLLLAFSQDEYRHANAMLCLLSGVM